MPMITDWITAIAAVLTLFSAIAALVVAFKAPMLVAQFSENLRRKNEEESERTRLRMNIFISLMKCRNQLLHRDAIDAINLVDVAFFDDQAVRLARRSFTEATLEIPHSAVKIVERYHVLIDKVANAVNYGSSISPSDIQGGYYPSALGRIDAAALAEAEEKIARTSNTGQQSQQDESPQA